MDALLRALHVLVPVLWTGAGAAYLVLFLRESERAATVARRLATASAIAHLAEFGLIAASGRPPIASGAALLSAMGLAAGLVYLVLERRVARGSAGVFAVGAVTLLAVAGAAAGDPFFSPAREYPKGSTGLHVIGAVMGYAGLLLAALFGGLFLVQRKALRERRFGLFWERLPSLDLLDAFQSGSLVAATIFLTATIALGHVVRRAAGDEGTYWDPKIIVTNALWFLTLVTTLLRRTRNATAAQASWAAVGLLLVALANVAVVNAFSRVHGKG